MSTLFASPWYVPVSGAGTTYPGAKLYFYETGTTTPKDTFSDPDLDPSHVHANPVVADADGQFPPIYLEAGEYKAVLKTSADATLDTVDPYSGLGAAETLTTRGDLLTRDGAGYKRLGVGTSGYYLSSNGTDPYWASPVIPRLAIQGLTYANNATDATNDIDVAVGGCMDSTSIRMMVLQSALTKKLDAAWAVGNNQGGLDAGSAADADYYIWLINRSDTDVTDVLISLSATSPTMPTNYNYRRLIGWFKRASSAIVAFKTYELAGGGLEFLWVAPREDIRLSATLTSTRRLDALSVPRNFSVVAFITPSFYDTSGLTQARICCPDEADAAVYTPDGAYTTGTRNGNMYSINTEMTSFGDLRIRTDATGQIAARTNAGVTADLYVVQTNGFEWSRR